MLSEARQHRNAAAASPTAAVKSGTAMAPAEPGFWSQMGDDVSDTFMVGQLADTSMATGIVDGAADIVKFGRTLDPSDQWNMEHPAEYVAGLNATLAGVADMEVNPRAAIQGLVGTGWGMCSSIHWAWRLTTPTRLRDECEQPVLAMSLGFPVREESATYRRAVIIRLTDCRGDRKVNIWTDLAMSGWSGQRKPRASHSSGMSSFRELGRRSSVVFPRTERTLTYPHLAR